MDGFVTLEELKSWIQSTQRRYIVEDVDRQWKAHNPKDENALTWDEYKKSSYGFVDGKTILRNIGLKAKVLSRLLTPLPPLSVLR